MHIHGVVCNIFKYKCSLEINFSSAFNFCICFPFFKTSMPATQSAVDVQYSGESSAHSSGMDIDENEYAGEIMVEGPDAAKMPDIHFSPKITQSRVNKKVVEDITKW